MLENDVYFEKVMSILNEGGYMPCPINNQVYTFRKIKGKLVGDKKAIKSIKSITTPYFHKKLKVSK